MLIRRIEPVRGRPAVRIHLRPASSYGARAFGRQLGSHHVRFSDATQSLRVTTDAPVSYLAEERVFILDRPVDLVLSDDETLAAPAHEAAAEALRATSRYWEQWVRGLAIPFEWQDATIRAAITLQLRTYDDNGTVLAPPPNPFLTSACRGRAWDCRRSVFRDCAVTGDAMHRPGASRA